VRKEQEMERRDHELALREEGLNTREQELAAREKELCASEEVGGHSALQKRPDLSDAIDTDENRVVDREELTGALQAGLSQDSNRQSEPPTAKLPSEERPELPSARVPKEFDYRAGDKLDMPYRGSGMHLPDEQALELSRVDSAAASYGPYDREEWNAAHRAPLPSLPTLPSLSPPGRMPSYSIFPPTQSVH